MINCRRFILGFLLLPAHSTLAQVAEAVDPPMFTPRAGEATVYFYRAGGAGRSTDVWAFVDETAIGVLRGRQYAGANVPAGQRLIWATSGSVWATLGNLEAGQTYYFGLVTTRAAPTRIEREILDAEQAAEDIQRASYWQLTAEGRRRAAEILQADYTAALEAAELESLARVVAEGIYPPGSRENLQAIYAYAEALGQHGSWSDARRVISRAISLIEEQHGESSVMLAEAYRWLGASYRHEGGAQFRSPTQPGMSALRRALGILEQQPDSDPGLLASVLLEMADNRTAASRDGTEHYLRAWDALEPLENADELRRDWFGSDQPVFLLRYPISGRGLSSSPNAVPGSVVVSFDIDDLGSPNAARVSSSEPPGFKDNAAIRAVRSSKFRPRIENRQVVPALGMTVEFTFAYLPGEVN